MKRIEANCPSCASPVEFKARSSLVTVCSACSSVVARRDRKLEDHGKVAAIVETDSPFHLGKIGKYRQHRYEIIGRVQYQHPAGGVWDEWYAAFPNNRWAWIAEAQGKRYITQRRDLNHHMEIPTWDSLQIGMSVALGTDAAFKVAEFNTASLRAAEGEVPIDVVPNAPHRFADLSGDKHGFATIAYGDKETTVFRGHEVTLEELGVTVPKPGQTDPKKISGTTVNCPKCAGPLALRAPDAAQRVTCPYCSSLLDVNHGSLTYLKTLKLDIQPLIEVGTEGTLGGVKYTVIGFMQRSVRFDREYSWEEYLLYDPATGFRWLVHSDRHWNFVEPITSDSITQGTSFNVDGVKYRRFQRAWAKVDYVVGEFYWKVSVGDVVLSIDYIAPPTMISLELTPESPGPRYLWKAADWESWRFVEQIASKGTYLPHQDVETAFGLKGLPRGAGIAPNQPGPDFREAYWMWPLFIGALVGIDLIVPRFASHAVDHTWTWLAVIAVSVFPIGLFIYSSGVEQSRWADSEFKPDGSLNVDAEDSDAGESDDSGD